jgi:hypothetical protein
MSTGNGLCAGAHAAAEEQASRWLWFGISLHLAWLVVCALAYPFETRLVNDINVWTKPIKFQVSLAMLLCTVWMLLPLLPAAVRASAHLRAACAALVLAAVFDMLLFTLQSARGVASHFNVATPLDARLYSMSGVAALVIVSSTAWVGWLMWRHRAAAAHRRGLMLGGAWGLMLGSVTTLVTADLMSAELLTPTGHWVGGALSDANGLPVVGWSTTGGDLRVSHFFATHLMQALPLMGWALDRWASPHRVSTGLWVGSGAGLTVVAATLLQALQGQPFIG